MAKFHTTDSGTRVPSESAKTDARHSLGLRTDDVVWALGSFCALHRKPFDPQLLIKQFPPPYTLDVLIRATRALGFRIKRRDGAAGMVKRLNFPCLVLVKAPASAEAGTASPEAAAQSYGEYGDAGAFRAAIVGQVVGGDLMVFEAGSNTPQTVTEPDFADRFAGIAFQVVPETPAPNDPDSTLLRQRQFGFRWFVPELLKHKRVWRDVLIASLIIQVLALSTPLFTQVVIDKVVVQHTQSTLLVIAVALGIFMAFSSLLTWVRQYLVLHTGNRVDAVLGAAVLEHLFKLPPRYFDHRPTGVITARLRGIENIREFIASAAVTLMLDLPFLVIFVAIMMVYSVSLTLICLALVAIVVVLSLVMAPIFRDRLNEQFLLGARNQAFTTEYVAGLETVKSLQLEPQLQSRYGDYLAEYLRSGFQVRQIGNTYNVAANGVEQVMTLAVLMGGAYLVMNDPGFTVGMMVAFQMFASRLSQPVLRLVGLWQQFQQANLSVQRLGDIMNAPAEPYAVLPNRASAGRGQIAIRGLSFRYQENLPDLFHGFDLTVEPGRTVAIMGPSGSGKSTLAKLLLGFYLPSGGTIELDGTLIGHLSANELRNYFGVVPQETVLFSGTLYDNLLMANPHATFDQVVQACRMAEIHDVIEALPQGYQTEIGERGAGLSGGQKQRISIARALLKQPKILIFDEATSNLDAVTAEHFAATINQLRGKVTMLFITHAVPKGLQVDKVIRVGDDRAMAVGPVQAEGGY